MNWVKGFFILLIPIMFIINLTEICTYLYIFLDLLFVCLKHSVQNTFSFRNRSWSNIQQLGEWEWVSDLKLIPSVDNEALGKGIHADPFAIVLDLKPSNSILCEEGEEAMIGMWGQPKSKVWLWTWRVQVHSKDLQARVKTCRLYYGTGFQPQALWYSLKQIPCHSSDFSAILKCKLPAPQKKIFTNHY